MTAEEWASLRLEFKKQALLGIGYCGITRLPAGQTPPIQVLAQWVHNAEKIRKKNEWITSECVELCRRLEHDGFDACILKGQSNLINYVSSDWSPYQNHDKNPSKNDGGDILGGSFDNAQDKLDAPQNPSENQTKNPEQNLAMYRTPGDIDVLMRSKEEPSAIDLPIRYCITQCNLHDVEVGKICYHHMDLSLTPNPSPKGEGSKNAPTPIEAHYRACWLSSPIRNHRLQRWLEDNMPFKTLSFSPLKGEGTIPIPSNSYNAIFQLIHIFKHLFEEGIGLRQLLDYYFVLKTLPTSLHREGKEPDHMDKMMEWARSTGKGEISREEIMHQLKRFGLDKFAAAVMYVLQEALDPSQPSLASTTLSIGAGQELDWQKRWPWMICEPNEKEGKWLLNEIMQAGNFGKYDERPPLIPLKGGKIFSEHVSRKLSRAIMLIKHYPHEALWQPYFMVYHWLWRRFELWK